jgi:hypothetical protein
VVLADASGHELGRVNAESAAKLKPSLVEKLVNGELKSREGGLDRDLYARAHRLDPADPVPLRYLGELYRHHTGDWVAARRVFRQLLEMPTDPISRAVALHGLGKMTIHDGDFAAGLALIERSIATYPLPLAYRNLAVYWNSEGQVEKAQGFAEKALALDPDDPYTQVFVAAFTAEDGRREEALRVAHANEDLLAASYNLAAIQCLLGHRDEALALLHRHFYDYERFDAVRSKEMKEAREDIVFTALKQDPDFIALTALAEKPKTATGTRSLPTPMPGALAPAAPTAPGASAAPAVGSAALAAPSASAAPAASATPASASTALAIRTALAAPTAPSAWPAPAAAAPAPSAPAANTSTAPVAGSDLP